MDIQGHDAATAGILGSIFTILVYAGKRLIDFYLPANRHHRWIDRYSELNDHDDNEKEDDDE